MRLLICILLSVITLYTNTLAEDFVKVKDLYYKKLPTDFTKKINFENPVKLRFDHTPENYNIIVDAIQEAKEESLELHYLSVLLDINQSIEMVPAIMRIVDDHRIEYTEVSFWEGDYGTGGSFEEKLKISELMLNILEDLYSFRLVFDESTNMIKEEAFYYLDMNDHTTQDSYFWKRLWQADSLNYKKWGSNFHKRLLEDYLLTDSLEVWQVNSLVSSKYRQTNDTLIWKKLLKKIVQTDLLILETDSVFKIDSVEELKHLIFDKMSLINVYWYINDYKKLSFPKLYKLLQKYNDYEQGEILSGLLELTNIKQAILHQSNRIDLDDQYIIEKIETFRNQANNISYLPISNFENHPLYFIKMSKMIFEEQLKYILNNLKGKTKEKELLALIETLTFTSLPKLLEQIDDIKQFTDYNNLIEAISTFVGIPIESISDYSIKTIIELFKTHSEKDFFLHFSSKFYPNLYRAANLDYRLVSTELRKEDALKLNLNYFPDVPPLIFSPALLLIRLLELEHDTRLGYEYQFDRNNPENVQKRINAWIEYLENKELINRN